MNFGESSAAVLLRWRVARRSMGKRGRCFSPGFPLKDGGAAIKVVLLREPLGGKRKDRDQCEYKEYMLLKLEEGRVSAYGQYQVHGRANRQRVCKQEFADLFIRTEADLTRPAAATIHCATHRR